MSELFAKRTGIGFVLKIAGLVVIAWGIIQGFIFMISFGDSFSDGMGIVGFLNTIFTYSICGILIIGFGEVIDLLQKIHDQNDPKAQVLQAMEDNSHTVANTPIPLAAEQEIKEFYANQNIWVDSISPTKNRDIFIVKVNGRTEYIELGDLRQKSLRRKKQPGILDKLCKWGEEQLKKLKGKYGILSVILSIVGLLLFYMSTFGGNGVLGIYFFVGIATWIASFVLGIKAVKSKESGSLKYIGMGIISLIIIGYASIIVLVGIRGFGA